MIARLCPYAISFGFAAVSLAACGGRAVGPTAIPRGVTAQSRAHHAATPSAILYVNRYSKYVDMLTYPGLKRVGSFTYPNNTPFGQPCPDDLAGSIYFPNYSGQPNAGLLEYADGGTTPIGSLKPPAGYSAVNCAVDPTTGNIAVVLSTTARTAIIGVYPPGSSHPTKYAYPHLRWYASCRYDSSGNLFVLGETTTYQSLFLELPKGGSELTKLSLKLSAYTLDFPILWDGSNITIQYLSVENYVLTIYRISVSGSVASVIGKTKLRRAAKAVWIQDGNTVITGRYPTNVNRYRVIAFYDYPSGKLRSIFQGLPYKKNQIIFLAVATPASRSRAR